MAEDQIEWESHYEHVVAITGLDQFASYDTKDPYISRMLRFGADRHRSLEFGSGKGGLSLVLKLATPSVEVHLLDFSTGAVEFSRQLFTYRGAEGHFHMGSFLDLPFPDDHFDFIHGNTVLEHVENTGKAVDELLRVLAPGGIALITVPNKWRRIDGHDVYHYINEIEYFSRTFWPKELAALWRDRGCEIEEMFGTGALYFFPTYPLQALRRAIRGPQGKATASRRQPQAAPRQQQSMSLPLVALLLGGSTDCGVVAKRRSIAS